MSDTQPPDHVAKLIERARAAQLAASAVIEEARANRQAVRAAREPLSARLELLRMSQNARLLARLQTMPVIEQAKGIIMSQSGCPPEAAFDMLRRASQRSNVPIRDLAATIVSNAAVRSSTPPRLRPTRATPLAPDDELGDAAAAASSA